MTWQLTLTGFLIGALVGVTGMGGGSLMTPILVIGFGFQPSFAIGTDILHGAIFKTVGAIRHRRLGNVQARLSGWMFLGSAPTSVAGVTVAVWLRHHYGSSVDSIQATILGCALIFGALGLLAKSMLRSRPIEDGPFRLGPRDRIAAVLIGLFGGFVVGLTSVGSGTFFGLTLLFLFPLRARKVVGTDIFHAAALLYIAGLGHLLAGDVDISAVGWLLLGSIPGVMFGTQWTVRMPDAAIRAALAIVLLLSGLKLVGLSPRELAIATVVGLLAVVAVNSVLRAGRLRRRTAEVTPALTGVDELVLAIEPGSAASQGTEARRPG